MVQVPGLGQPMDPHSPSLIVAEDICQMHPARDTYEGAIDRGAAIQRLCDEEGLHHDDPTTINPPVPSWQCP